MCEKRIYLYAIEQETCRVLNHQYIVGEDISICGLLNAASRLTWICKHAKVDIYAVDMRPGLARDYQDSVRSALFTDWVHFKDILQREGIKLN